MSDVWLKACQCDGAGASGPRVVIVARTVERRPEWDGHGLRATFAFVKMACDRCDTPWKLANPVGPA